VTELTHSQRHQHRHCAGPALQQCQPAVASAIAMPAYGCPEPTSISLHKCSLCDGEPPKDLCTGISNKSLRHVSTAGGRHSQRREPSMPTKRLSTLYAMREAALLRTQAAGHHIKLISMTPQQHHPDTAWHSTAATPWVPPLPTPHRPTPAACACQTPVALPTPCCTQGCIRQPRPRQHTAAQRSTKSAPFQRVCASCASQNHVNPAAQAALLDHPDPSSIA
jgi:hypothetical protein